MSCRCAAVVVVRGACAALLLAALVARVADAVEHDWSTEAAPAPSDGDSWQQRRLPFVTVHGNGGDESTVAFVDATVTFAQFVVHAALRLPRSLRGNCVPLTRPRAAQLGVSNLAREHERRGWEHLGAPQPLCDPEHLRVRTRKNEAVESVAALQRVARDAVEQRVPEDAWLFLVPAHESFVWPAPYAGYTVELRGYHRDPEKPIDFQAISTRPRAFIVENFLTDDECDELIAKGRDAGLSRSQIGGHDDASGAAQSVTHGDVSDRRTSTQAWISDSHIASYAQRGANFTDTTVPQQESLQVLNYQRGGHYWAHCDFDTSEPCMWEGRGTAAQNNRFITLFFYLNEGMQGGHTQFLRHMHPYRDATADAMRRNNQDYVDCGDGITVKPRRGRALMWYNLDVRDYVFDPQPDVFSEHAACQVTGGEKWAANFWIHNRHLQSGDIVYRGTPPLSHWAVEKTHKRVWRPFYTGPKPEEWESAGTAMRRRTKRRERDGEHGVNGIDNAAGADDAGARDEL